MGWKLPPEVLAKLPAGTPVNGEALGLDVPESAFQATVISFAESKGWAVFSVPDSRRATTGGFQDCTFRHDTGSVAIVVAELKRVGEKPRADQRAWLSAWERMGVPTFVWTPADWKQIREVLG